MTKAVLDIDTDLWKQARAYGLANDLNNRQVVTLALERLIHGGHPIHDRMEHLATPLKDQPLVLGRPSPASFGYSRPVPKPMKKGR